MDSKGKDKITVHPLLKINYLARIIIAIFGSIITALTIYILNVEFLLQKIIGLCIFWLAWPHIAYVLAINQKDLKQAETRNVLFDFVLTGFVIGIFEINPWPSFAAIIIMVGNSIISGGFSSLLKSIPVMLFGLVIKFLFFGVDINLEAHFWISMISAGGILTYTILLSSVSYSQAQQRIEIKNQLKNKSRQLQSISQELSEFLPSQLVDNISEGKVDSVSTHKRKKLTMFFSDIKDFTKITDTLEPEDMANILNEYITEMNKIIIKHKGTLAQVIGDGLYIFFGAPKNTNDKDNAIKCLKMAMDMQLKIKKLNQKWFLLGIDKELEIRCGINTGMATVGGYGSSERKEYTAMGMQVNIAARLESACTPGKILMSHTTWVLVKDDIPYLEKGEFEIKGYHLPIKVYEVQV